MKRRKFFKRLGVVILAAGVLVACSEKEEVKDEKVEENTEQKATEVKEDVTMKEEEQQEKTNLYENERFKITEVDVQEDLYIAKIKGKAMVYEATVSYYVDDGYEILSKGFTTATMGAPEWGDFEFEVKIEKDRLPIDDEYYIMVYEESMKDGSNMYELKIPIEIKNKK